MKLLSNEILERLPKLGALRSEKDPVLQTRLFEPSTSRNWYPTEYDGEDYLFGLIECPVTGLSWCHFRLLELEAECEAGQLFVECDPDFQPRPANVVVKGRFVHPYPGCLHSTHVSTQEGKNIPVQAESLAELITVLTASAPSKVAGPGVLPLPIETGLVFEINEETYDFFLKVLPPQFVSGQFFCFAEGFSPHTLFFHRNGRYFVRRLTQAETKELCHFAEIPLPGYW